MTANVLDDAICFTKNLNSKMYKIKVNELTITVKQPTVDI